MKKLIARTAAVLLLVTAAACNGDSQGPNQQFSALAVSPVNVNLFTVEPGNTATLSWTARDQSGQTMTVSGSPTFSSNNTAIATVNGSGGVTAGQPGTAKITASLTVGSATHSAEATVVVFEAQADADVTAPQFSFQPAVSDVRAGGTVRWTMANIPHDVTFTSPGAPANIGTLTNATDSRVFPNNGTYTYQCTIHAGMTGSVRVH